jgi:hypothetical protein
VIQIRESLTAARFFFFNILNLLLLRSLLHCLQDAGVSDPREPQRSSLCAEPVLGV